MTRSILIRLAGGLGNQLFQFAAGIKALEMLGIGQESLFIDTRFLARYESQHKYELDFIVSHFPLINVGILPNFPSSIASRFRLARIFNCNVGRYALVSTPENLLNLHSQSISNTVLDGYFQHPDMLFDDNQRIQLRERIFKENHQIISSIIDDFNIIGVHIRRGDYVTSKSASRDFCTISLDYYRTAVNKLPSGYKILVFSDDRELSKSFADEIGGTDVRAHNLSLKEEFVLLATCDHYVIANSTFSWWASYLGWSPGKRVITPSRWYVDKNRSNYNPLILPHHEQIYET